MTRFFLYAICLHLSVVFAFAVDPSTSVTKGVKIDKEKSQSVRATEEQRESEGEREAKTKSTGVDKQTQEALRATLQAQQSGGLDITVPLESLFLDHVAELEKNTPPFSECGIVSAPRLPRDFGLSAEIQPGVIDTIKQQFLSQAASSNAAVSQIVNEQDIRRYRDCLLFYGAVIGQAAFYLSGDIQTVARTKKEDGEDIAVQEIGYDDLVSLAEGALQKAIAGGFQNTMIKNFYNRTENNSSPCQFEREITNVRCGNALLVLGTIPQLTVAGIKWYGGGAFAGVSGNYKVSAGWSYSDAVERLKTTAKYAKFAEEVSKYSEELNSQGKAREAVMLKRKAFELAKNNQNVVSLSRLMPGIGQ